MPSAKRRQNSCCAPDCQTGYIRVKGVKTASLFGVPKDSATKDFWKKNLQLSDKRLEETSAICELHFEPHFILQDNVHIIDGTEDSAAKCTPDLSGDPPVGQEERKRKANPPKPIVEKRSGITRETDPLSPVVNSEAPAVIPQGIDRDALDSLNMPTPYWPVHKFSNFQGVAYLETALEPKFNKIGIERAGFISTLVNELKCNTHKIVAARALGIKQKTLLVTFEGKTVPRHVRYVFEVYKVKNIKLSWKTLPDAMGSDHLPIRIELPTNGTRRRDAPFIRWDTFRDTIKTNRANGDRNTSPFLPQRPLRELHGCTSCRARAGRDKKVVDKIKLLINGEQIKSQTSIRILGITIDENGKAGSWYQQIKSQWKQALNMIKLQAVPPGQGLAHPVVDEDIEEDIDPSEIKSQERLERSETRRSTQARRTPTSIDILQSVGACTPTKVAHRNLHDTGLEV
ncbi:hypothetical protein HPB47_000066 [Ixodes persulcatus]|uniref:Uncharacterized protein n=1 Tax=Ixodes persulcatus TaxID=34615 RepID=A0AC60PSU8_IXOPE|nr:hypothetical protein HPB47_000066 [Ixodes persulcatus]